MDQDPFLQRILKTGPCPYLVKYSLDILKKKTKCQIKNYIELSPQDIRIRIRFLEINGSTSLVHEIFIMQYILYKGDFNR